MQKVLFQYGLTDKIISKIKDTSPKALIHSWNSPKEQISRTITGGISKLKKNNQRGLIDFSQEPSPVDDEYFIDKEYGIVDKEYEEESKNEEKTPAEYVKEKRKRENELNSKIIKPSSSSSSSRKLTLT
jgi:hypothetical protein